MSPPQPEKMQPAQQVLNVAAYKFVPLDDLSRRRGELRSLCVRLGLRGTILLSPEGINLFVAGDASAVRELLDTLRQESGLEDLEVKESYSDSQPFNRMLVKHKREIIAFGQPDIDPVGRPAPTVSAETLKGWLDQGRSLVLLDVRNDYEVELGTFRGAVNLGLSHFRDFPRRAAELSAFKDHTIVSFCTGGIRCEKAAPFLRQQGFSEVYQLEGGILKYFEVCGGAHYQGECFVFDKRVALDASLAETMTTQCYCCQAVVTPEMQQSSAYIPESQCPKCASDAR